MEAAFFFFFFNHAHGAEPEWIKICRTEIRLDDHRFNNYPPEDRLELGRQELKKIQDAIHRVAGSRGVELRLVRERVKTGSIIGSYSVEIHTTSFENLAKPNPDYKPSLHLPGLTWESLEPHLVREIPKHFGRDQKIVVANEARGNVSVSNSDSFGRLFEDAYAKAPPSQWENFKKFFLKDSEYGPLVCVLTALVFLNGVIDSAISIGSHVKNIIIEGVKLYQSQDDSLPVVGHQTRQSPIIEIPKATQDAYGIEIPYVNPGRARELKGLLAIHPLIRELSGETEPKKPVSL